MRPSWLCNWRSKVKSPFLLYQSPFLLYLKNFGSDWAQICIWSVTRQSYNIITSSWYCSVVTFDSYRCEYIISTFGMRPGCVFAIPNPFSYGACISLWRSIEKKGQIFVLALRGLELTDFGSTAQCSTNDTTNKSLCKMVYWRNKPIH